MVDKTEVGEAKIAKSTYHGDVGVSFEKLGDLGQLVLEVVDPDIADVGALVGVGLEVSQLVLVLLLEVEWLGLHTKWQIAAVLLLELLRLAKDG